MLRDMRAILLCLTALVACAPDTIDSSAAVEVREAALVAVGGGHASFRIVTQYLSPGELTAALDALATSRSDIDAFATAPNGSWVIVGGGTRRYSAGFPDATRRAIEAFVAAGQPIRAIDFNASGGWAVLTNSQQAYGGTVPDTFRRAVAIYRMAGIDVEDADITDDGYVLVGSGPHVSVNLPGEHPIEAVLADRELSRRKVRQVDLGFDGRWVVVSDQEAATSGVSQTFSNRMRTLARGHKAISKLMFGLDDDYVVTSYGDVAQTPGNLAEVLEYDVGGKTIWQAMADATIPGLTIALVENAQVTSVRGYGRLHADEQRPMLGSTPYDVASLTKYVSSLTVLKLVDEGKLDLERDIRTDPGPHIRSWIILGSNPVLSGLYGMPGKPLPSESITPTGLMRHRAGFPNTGTTPYAHPNHWNKFDTEDQTLLHLLGWSCSDPDECALSGRWSWATAPSGGEPVYSNQNFVVLMALAEDATDKRGSELFQELLINPMGLKNTSAKIPLDPDFEARTAWQHSSTGEPRPFRALFPYTWAGGLVASAGDYAELMILALNQGVDSRGIRRIPAHLIDAMLDGETSQYGFGLQFRGSPNTNALEGSDNSFRHTGSHGNRTRTVMCGNPQRNEGIVVFTNRGKDTDGEDEVIDGILRKYTRTRQWPTTCH